MVESTDNAAADTSASARGSGASIDDTVESRTVVLTAMATPPVASTPITESVVASDVLISLTVGVSHLEDVHRTSKICPINTVAVTISIGVVHTIHNVMAIPAVFAVIA